LFIPAGLKEATRDGAPAIDLIDGEAFAEQRKDLGLRVQKELVEVAKVNDAWFEGV
jgi:restriction system protein